MFYLCLEGTISGVVDLYGFVCADGSYNLSWPMLLTAGLSACICVCVDDIKSMSTVVHIIYLQTEGQILFSLSGS